MSSNPAEEPAVETANEETSNAVAKEEATAVVAEASESPENPVVLAVPDNNNNNNDDDDDEKKKVASTSPLDENQILQARRKIALEALCDAEDLPTISNLLALVKELHEGFPMHPSAADLVNKAAIASEYLMYQSVMERLTRPRSFGGLAWAESKAKQIADRLFETMGSACCATDVSENKLVKKGGQEKTEARRILSHLIAVGEEIEAKKEEIRAKVLEAPEAELLKVATELAIEASKKVVVSRPKSDAPSTPNAASKPAATKSPRSRKRKSEIPLAEDLGDGKRSLRARKKVDYGPLTH